VIVCCEHTVKTTVSDIGLLLTVSAGGRQVSHSRLTDWLDNTALLSPAQHPDSSGPVMSLTSIGRILAASPFETASSRRSA
jgi:hypothetical protein